MKPFKVTLTGPRYGVTELIMADSIEEAKEKMLSNVQTQLF